MEGEGADSREWIDASSPFSGGSSHCQCSSVCWFEGVKWWRLAISISNSVSFNLIACSSSSSTKAIVVLFHGIGEGGVVEEEEEVHAGNL